MKKNLLKTFFITLSILLIVFIMFGIYPFGDKTIIVIDSNTQYVSFISYLKSIFLSNNDLKYSFSGSLGANLIPLLGYYLMSPFNLLSILFNLENIKLFMTVSIIIKICLCSVSMEYFLNKKFNTEKSYIFSISYALMAYNIVYMYHLMWLDSVILFPLVILGIDYIFKERNVLPYIITLSLSIIFNYYIGVMICIASVIYFIYKFILDYKISNKVKVITNYSISSLLAGLLSMFILLPSLLGLQGGKASFSLENLDFSFNTSYINVIAKTFTASLGDGETWHGGPMIACGMFIFILIVMYFFNKKINKKEKIIDAVLLIILASTFVIKPLDLLFHGLNVPNCFDYRHAFIFVFFYILISFKNYKNIDLNKKQVKTIIYIISIIFAIIYLCKFKMFTSMYNLSLIYSFIISLLFIYLLFKRKNKYIYLLVVLDLIINTASGVLLITLSDKQSINNYQNYIIDTKEVINEINDDSFYRLEKTYDRETNENMLSINDSMIFNYNGISHFDSTSKESTEEFLENLGYRKLITRAYYNMNGGTTLGDSILGIKYVLSKDKYKNYEEVLTKNDITIYKNPYYLSIGYSIKNDNVVFTNNVFENQNNLIKSFTEIDEDIYDKALYEVSYDNIEIRDNKYISNGIGTLIYKIKITDENNLYLGSRTNEYLINYTNALMYVNGIYVDDYFTKYNSAVYDLGRFKKGDIVEIRFEFKEELIMDDIYFYYEDLNILEKHYDVLKQNQLNIKKVSSSHLMGDIELEEPSKILFTIPYDDGWNIYVNGERQLINKSFDALMTIDLAAGIHEIELKFEPKGLKLGIIISSVSILVTVLFVLYDKKTKKNS